MTWMNASSYPFQYPQVKYGGHKKDKVSTEVSNPPHTETAILYSEYHSCLSLSSIYSPSNFQSIQKNYSTPNLPTKMYPSTILLAASSFISLSSCLPMDQLLSARDQICGKAPSDSNTQQPVLSQPSGLQNAAACQSDCDANSACLSFLFGLVDNNIKCLLYACAASAIPPPSSPDLIAYDKACPSVPTVTPTPQNPTGVNTENNANTKSNTNTENNANTENKSNPSEKTTQAGNHQTRGLVARDTCGGAPSGPSNAQPISAPAGIDTLPECKAKCIADPSCER